MNTEAHDGLVQALKSQNGFQMDDGHFYFGSTGTVNPDALLANLTANGYVLVKLPEPDDSGDFGQVWTTDGRFKGPIGTVQYRPQSGRIEIRDDYEHDYRPADIYTDATVLLAAAKAAEAVQ